ncbi:hypothetical protein Clacol_008290 [Clathrus columnatus]|uniref:Uncharacterized protein n=1 Tax=Clathrus columnatus TaxID=1419009 RepID=A0AAV5ALQ9_9AGAM|nr:hypothetical protein Clacol_008290 [Clathrus columnatus]
MSSPPSYSKLPSNKSSHQSSHQSSRGHRPNSSSNVIDIPNERSSLLPSPPPSLPPTAITFTNSRRRTVQVNRTCSGDVLALSPTLWFENTDLSRQRAGVVWSAPVEGLCLQYGSRSYSEKLLHYPLDDYWQEACDWTPIIMQGKKIRKKNMPFWGPIENKHCSGSDRIITTRLMNVENGTQWKAMCQTTPFHINGMTEFPMSCENKGPDGIWGYMALNNDGNCVPQERIKQREAAGVTWSLPQPGKRLQYAIQEYSTTLLHYEVDEYWNEACETTELKFNDQRLKTPNKCEIIRNVHNKPQVVGHWHITGDSPECTPYWISVSNEMVSAILWNLKDPKQWDVMCDTAPLTLQGVSRVPLSCENKGWGILGHWEIRDESCDMLV